MLEPWSQPTYLTRAWCLFELNTAIGERSIEIDVILTDEQYRSFLEAMSTQSYSCIDEAVRCVFLVHQAARLYSKSVSCSLCFKAHAPNPSHCSSGASNRRMP